MAAHNPRSGRSSILAQLWFQVLVGTLLGIAVGWLAPGAGSAMKPLGDAFIKLIRMMIGPVIFVTVVHGITRVSDMRSVGWIALKSLIYFEVITLLALVIGLVAVELWRPGAGMNIDPSRIDASAIRGYIATAHDQTVTGYLMSIIPDTLLGALTAPAVLPVLLVSVLFGVALAAGGEHSAPVLQVIDGISRAVFRIIGYIMYVAPIGAFGAIAFTIGQFGAGSLLSLGALIVEFFVVCALFTAIVLGAVAWWCGVHLGRLLGFIRDEIVIVAATTSTETVLPRLIVKLEQLGCEDSVVGFVIPAGYSFNLDGTCLYLTTVSVFLAQATSTQLTLWQQLGLIAVLLVTSKGAAGVAGAAFVVLAATLGTTGTIPVASIALVLGIHRVLAEGLTFVNLVGNCVATIAIARWEGKLDHAQLARRVGTSASRQRYLGAT
ncbi:MAG TPA: C4-dicarboxylate transporter DctA [Kofleriaceae bacterium]|jgi:aerobic C4-dicarboxylate transport protein|nr:C4-dicarboxylate transporter DctA [Kofleriaceae bacterium]